MFKFIPNTLLCLIALSKARNKTYYEYALQQALLSGYSTTTRPVDNFQVSVMLRLSQIISLKEHTKTMTTSSYLFLMWNDPRLTWDPSLYGGIDMINILAT